MWVIRFIATTALVFYILGFTLGSLILVAFVVGKNFGVCTVVGAFLAVAVVEGLSCSSRRMQRKLPSCIVWTSTESYSQERW